MIKRHARAREVAAESAKSTRMVDQAASCLHVAEAIAHPRTVVRLRSCAGEGLHGWEEECPKCAELCLNDHEFQFSVRMRLGWPLVQAEQCQFCSRNGED